MKFLFEEKFILNLPNLTFSKMIIPETIIINRYILDNPHPFI